jgi:hypothetical protein
MTQAFTFKVTVKARTFAADEASARALIDAGQAFSTPEERVVELESVTDLDPAPSLIIVPQLITP